MSFDVVVLGAGLSGLSCARLLRRAGARVCVLEARDRVGGRTLSRAFETATLDLGGQWIGPGHDRLDALARELGVETFPTHDRGKRVLVVGDDRRTYRGTIPRIPPLGLAALGLTLGRIELLARRAPAKEPWASARAKAWDARSADELLPDFAGAHGRAAFDAAVRTIFGADARELSQLYAAWYARHGGGFFNLVEVAGGAQERRFVQGAQSLSIGIAKELGDAVRLSSPVTRLVHSNDGVEARANGEVVRAACAVVAVPRPIANKIEFSPALPPEVARLHEDMKMGATTKVLALYDRAFWRDAGLSGEAVFAEGPLSVVFDNVSHDGRVAGLVGFIVGDNAHTWRARDTSERRAAVLASLARAFGDAARSPATYVEQDWASEPWSGGCPVGIFPPGAFANGAALRAPCGRIHWAGTESATKYAGYLEGAIEAGERAAHEILGG
jgi:monoamine oxidase